MKGSKVTRKVPVVFLNIEGESEQVKVVGMQEDDAVAAMAALGKKVVGSISTEELYGCSLTAFCRIAKPMISEAE